MGAKNTLSKHFNISILPKNFRKQQITNSIEDNEYLEDLKKNLILLFRKLRKDLQRIPSHVELKSAFVNPQSSDFFTYATAFAEKSGERINEKTGKQMSRWVKHHYVRTVNYLFEYDKKMTFENITLETYKGYIQYLTNKKNLAPATIAKHVSDWKHIMNASYNVVHHNSIYKKFKKPSVEDLDAVFCEEWQLDELFKKKFDNPTWTDVKECFIVGCWTCLRHGNYGNIDKNYISENYIKLLPIKDGKSEVMIPLHPHVKAILKRRKGPLPVVSNKKMNELLPVVCAQVKCFRKLLPKRFVKGGKLYESFVPMYEMIKSHTARRSFATNADLRGIPDNITMMIGGWESIQSLQRYKRTKPIQAAKHVEELWKKVAIQPV